MHDVIMSTTLGRRARLGHGFVNVRIRTNEREQRECEDEQSLNGRNRARSTHEAGSLVDAKNENNLSKSTWRPHARGGEFIP